MTPQELAASLALKYHVDLSDGSVSFKGSSHSVRVHTIMANGDDPSGEVRDDVMSIVEHLCTSGIGETGTYKLMQWLSPAEAAIFAGLFESEEEIEAICLTDANGYNPNGDPTDSQDFFESEFEISGYYREVTTAIRQDLNDCSSLQLMLIPKNES